MNKLPNPQKIPFVDSLMESCTFLITSDGTNIMQPKFYAVYKAQVEKTMQLPIFCIFKDIKCLFSLLPDIKIYT